MDGLPVPNSPVTIGYDFTVGPQSVVLTALGVFDSGQDGLMMAHPIGLWTSGGTLLTSATVSAGTSATLIDRFRYADVAPVTLLAGQTYRLGALFPSSGAPDAYLLPSSPITGFQTNPLVTFGVPRFASGGTLSDPTSAISGIGYFGPNALIDVPSSPAVPEPGALAVFGTLAAVAFGYRRRIKGATAA
jgi:hypothetical protein